MDKSNLSWRQFWVVSITLVLSVAITSFMAIGIDFFTNGSAWPSLTYCGVIGVCLLPVIPALVLLKRLSLWFGFGVWLGVLCLLHWIPYCEEKAFFIHGYQIHEGMTLNEVRAEMKGYSESTNGVTYDYQWDPDGVCDMDLIEVEFLGDGHVYRVHISTED